MQILARGMNKAYLAMVEGRQLNLDTVFEEMSNAFTMLTEAHWSVTLRRCENIQPYMLQQYKALCNEDLDVAPPKYLFGKCVAKRMEAIDKMKKTQKMQDKEAKKDE